MINDPLEPGDGPEGQDDLQEENRDKLIQASQALLDIYVCVQRGGEPVLILCSISIWHHVNTSITTSINTKVIHTKILLNSKKPL